MSSLHQLRHGLNRLWDNLTEGWQQLRERAGQAVTHFSPTPSTGRVATREDRLVRSASRWGLLAADVQEDHHNVIVRLEVPGMEAEDFDLSVEDDYLVVRGEKKVQHEHNDGRFYSLECAYGRFERALPLPAAVDQNQAQAKYKRGVLTITLPKLKQSASRRIEIKG